MIPQLYKAHSTLEKCFAGTNPFAPIIVVMPQGGTSDAVLKVTLQNVTALIHGMHEMRASAVTRQTLTEFHQLQSNEMQTYVQAGAAPLHRGMQQFMQHVSQLET